MFDDPMILPSETEITASIKRLVVEPPIIAFLSGNDERSINKEDDKNIKWIAKELGNRYSLINQGFDVEDFSIENKEIPKNVSILVIADPASPFSNAQIERINRYISGGGNLMILSEPGKSLFFNALTKPMGVSLMNDTLTQISKDFEPDFIFANLSADSFQCNPNFYNFWKDHARVSMPVSTGLQYDTSGSFKVAPILISSANNRHNSVIPVAVSLARTLSSGKEQRIFIAGNTNFISNAELQSRVRSINRTFIEGIFSWLSYGEFPINTERPKPQDTVIKLKEKDLLGFNLFFGSNNINTETKPIKK
jgi:ABC-2 type transport system permease protein